MKPAKNEKNCSSKETNNRSNKKFKTADLA